MLASAADTSHVGGHELIDLQPSSLPISPHYVGSSLSGEPPGTGQISALDRSICGRSKPLAFGWPI